MSSVHTAVDKGIAKLIYSVIEKGVCRIVTSRQPQLLDELKTLYIQSLPAQHQLIWLPGDIQSIEELAQALTKAGVLNSDPVTDKDALESQIRQQLIHCHQNHQLQIWAFEQAEQLSEPVHKFLASLVSWRYVNVPMLSVELWGDANLDKQNRHGKLLPWKDIHCYPIAVGKKIYHPPQKSTSLQWGLGSLLTLSLLWAGANDLLPPLSSTDQTPLSEIAASPAAELTPQLTSQQPQKAPTEHPTQPDDTTGQSADSIISTHPISGENMPEDPSPALAMDKDIAIAQPSEKPTDVAPVETSVETPIVKTKAPATATKAPEQRQQPIIVASVTTQPPADHWFYGLSFPEWRDQHQINLNDDIQRTPGTFHLQLGMYKQQNSLKRFFTKYQFPDNHYHFCYSGKYQAVSLVTGPYESYRHAFRQYQQLKKKGIDTVIASVEYLQSWQCSN